VIACTEPAHVKRLNDLNKELQTWLDEHRRKILPNFEGTPSELLDEILNLEEKEKEKIFKEVEKFKALEMPWKGFPEAVESEIQKIVISQKPKDKLLIQPDQNAKFHVKIRGQLHEPMPFGLTNSKEAKRYPLADFAKDNFATEKNIEKITDERLKSEIRSHFDDKYKKNKKDAFSAEGILDFNSTRKVPVYSVRLYYKNQDKKVSVNKLGQKNSDTLNLLNLIINNEVKQKLKAHFEKYNSDKLKAFSKEGILELNKAEKKPIKSIKLANNDPNEQGDSDLTLQKLVRNRAFNSKLFVSTGDNYLFAVLEKKGSRVFDLITFFDAANLLNARFNAASDDERKNFQKELVFKKYFEEENETTKGSKLLFTLKQGDPVYMPSKNEEIITDPESPLFQSFWKHKGARSKNVYYVTKYSGNEIYFISHTVANSIVNKKEFGSQNAYQSINGVSIKQECIKLLVDRLGNITPEKKTQLTTPEVREMT
jgi:hypothetical protein